MDWFLQNWQFVVSAVAFILALLISIIRKKPVTSLWSELIVVLCDLCPKLIVKAEESGNDGDVKKAYVLACLNKYAKKFLNRDLTADETAYLTSLFSEKIETFLSLPTKKEVIANENEK